MVHYAVNGCPSKSYEEKDRKLSWHTFPKHGKLKKKWCDLINLDENKLDSKQCPLWATFRRIGWLRNTFASASFTLGIKKKSGFILKKGSVPSKYLSPTAEICHAQHSDRPTVTKYSRLFFRQSRLIMDVLLQFMRFNFLFTRSR